ncbi:uncharacterized protein [Littorina saxatilis]|uniref:uncharacterized protein isoform X1 n=1 Tax=Littorina saxatilis TaxID=31220 RepID=UPI0038B6A2C6
MCTSVTLPMIFPPQPSFGATSKQQGHSKTTRPGRVLIPSTSHTTSQDPSPTPGPSKATGPDHIATPLISSTSSGVSSPTPDYPLLANWKKSLPDEDQKWISQTFFKRNARGVPVFQDDKACQQQWYHPSEPQMSGTVPPSMDRYFSHSLFMWLPKRTWKWDFRCPGKCANMNPRPELSLAGIHSKVQKCHFLF